MAAQNY